MTPVAIIEFTLAAIFAISLVGLFSGQPDRKSSRIYRQCMMLAVLWLAIDATAYTLKGSAYPFVLRYVLNLLSYLSGNFVIIAFIRYRATYIRERTDLNRWLYRIPTILLLLCILITAAEYFAGHIIVYENGTATSVIGLPISVSVLQLLCLLFLPFAALSKRKALGLSQAMLLGSFDLIPIISYVILYLTEVDLTVIFGSAELMIVTSILQQKRAQEQVSRLEESLTFMNFFLDSYRSAFYIDLDTLEYRIVKEPAPEERRYLNAGPYLGPLTAFLEKTVHPDDLKQLLELIRPDQIKQLLTKQGEYTRTFRDISTKPVRTIRLQVIRGADGHHAALGFRDITEDIRGQQQLLLGELRHRETETRLRHEQLRGEVLNYMIDHEDDPIELLKQFAERLRVLIGCDQVIYRDLEETRIMVNSPAIEKTWAVPIEYCRQCEHFDAHHPMYAGGYTEMEDCRKGWQGIPVYRDCPIRSSLTRIVYCDGAVAGYLAIHYVQDHHRFTNIERTTLEQFTRILSISLSRYAARQENRQLKRINEMQAQLATALEDAQAANKAKTTFLFNMSHDIRTPMNAILGYTDVALRHENDPARVDDSLRKIRTSGSHLLSLINDVLEMSRIESGKLELSSEPLDLREAVRGVESMSRALAIPKSIRFEVRIGEIRDPYILADELHFNEMLINIISNAMKYSREDGTVRYSVDQISGVTDGIARYRFVIEDNGIGMSEEFLGHIYESFSRERTSTVSRLEGAGLGLSIVKRIVDLAGGTIDIRSKPGEGTTVTVELPFRVTDEESVREFRAEHGRSAAPVAEYSLQGKRALLVEDNEMNREIAQEILEEAGLTVETAEDGDIAVRMIGEKTVNAYDFILMDIQMPVMNGYDATRAIRALPDGDRIPIIAVSANAFEEDRKLSMEAGMNAHIAKPIDVNALLSTMQELSGRQEAEPV